MYDFYLTCPRGLEQIAFNELKNLVKSNPSISKGGVYFKGDLEDMYRVNYCTRVGMSVLMQLLPATIKTHDQLYEKIYDFPWHKIINVKQTFMLRSKINSESFTNSNYTTLKIKDAIVDRINKEIGKRPFVDKSNPDIYINIYIKDSKLKVFLNSSGKPLFMRGYRTKIHKASLNESLAAGIVQLSNWDMSSLFYDFMCGSGTLCIEAAMLASNIPAAILRKSFSFYNWNNFDEKLWNKVKNKANQKIKNSKANIYGSDLIANNIVICNQSSKIVNLESILNFNQNSFTNVKPDSNRGVVIINPPYGYRIGDQEKLEILYKGLGDHFKKYCSGFDCYIFSGNLDLLKTVGLRSKSRTILKNGKLDCRLVHYPMKEGKY